MKNSELTIKDAGAGFVNRIPFVKNRGPLSKSGSWLQNRTYIRFRENIGASLNDLPLIIFHKNICNVFLSRILGEFLTQAGQIFGLHRNRYGIAEIHRNNVRAFVDLRLKHAKRE